MATANKANVVAVAVTVDIVLPCLDEAEALPGVLAAMPAGYRVLVVDNGSTDDTAAVAAACGATGRATAGCPGGPLLPHPATSPATSNAAGSAARGAPGTPTSRR